MENTRDTFYIALRDRIAAINSGRTIVLRGTTRPSVLVEENELPGASFPTDTFCLRWGNLQVTSAGPMPLVSMACEIRYATDGSSGNGGMDRGRLLAGMDGELIAALGASSRTLPKMNFQAVSAGVPPVAMGTNIFWGELSFASEKTLGERVERVATVEVFSYQEAGEL